MGMAGWMWRARHRGMRWKYNTACLGRLFVKRGGGGGTLNPRIECPGETLETR